MSGCSSPRRANVASHFALPLIAAVFFAFASCGNRAATTAGVDLSKPTVPSGVVQALEATETATPANAGPPTGRPDLLSQWGQLDVQDGQLTLGEGVVSYTLNSALFSDYALKLRTVWLPDGSEPAVYDFDHVFDFPLGTVITKTFYYPLDDTDGLGDDRVLKIPSTPGSVTTGLDLDQNRLLETRVLVHREDGWAGLPYVWNADQTEAILMRTGDLIPLTLIDAEAERETAFTYVVPNVNQCAGCHTSDHSEDLIAPIGPKARHLNLDVALGDGVLPQLEHWQTLGLVAELPDFAQIPRAAVWHDDSAPLDDRARAYFDINCAHCHNSVGPADTSGLFLESTAEVGVRLGICKPPIAAGTGTGGRFVGISPGEPENSIFIYRMETLDPGAMMPELGRSLAHVEGVDLISSWIHLLDGDC